MKNLLITLFYKKKVKKEGEVVVENFEFRKFLSIGIILALLIGSADSFLSGSWVLGIILLYTGFSWWNHFLKPKTSSK